MVISENVNQKEQKTTSASVKMAISSMRRLEPAYQFAAYVSAFNESNTGSSASKKLEVAKSIVAITVIIRS